MDMVRQEESRNRTEALMIGPGHTRMRIDESWLL